MINEMPGYYCTLSAALDTFLSGQGWLDGVRKRGGSAARAELGYDREVGGEGVESREMHHARLSKVGVIRAYATK